jgi:hypothetical protein
MSETVIEQVVGVGIIAVLASCVSYLLKDK